LTDIGQMTERRIGEEDRSRQGSQGACNTRGPKHARAGRTNQGSDRKGVVTVALTIGNG